MVEPLRLTRDLIGRLPSRTNEQDPVTIDHPADDYYWRTADDLLSRLGRTGTLWVFAAGSLIWKPRFEVVERRVAYLKGWRRAFCISDLRFRGSPAAPGLMMSLVRGDACAGVALRMAPDNLFTSLVGLLETEPPLPPEWVEAYTDAGPVQALLFAADADWPFYRPEPAEEELADILASAVGHVGTMAEYLLNTVTAMESVHIHDPHLWSLQAKVAERLGRLPAL